MRNQTRSWWSRRRPGQRGGIVAATVLFGGLLGIVLVRAPSSAADEQPTAPVATTRQTSAVLPPSGGCDPNYDGCVPLVGHVDCAGHGEGPVFVNSPVRVLGEDHFGLDPDGNHIACD